MLQEETIYSGRELNLPKFKFRIQKLEQDKFGIFDELRKKILVLTPEEWVRQHIIRFLIEFKQYPQSLMALEKGIKYNELSKRFDVLVLDRIGAPFLLIECKAPEVKLTQKAVEQVCLYNNKIGAKFLGISNGMHHIFIEKNEKTGNYEQINHFPLFK